MSRSTPRAGPGQPRRSAGSAPRPPWNAGSGSTTCSARAPAGMRPPPGPVPEHGQALRPRRAARAAAARPSVPAHARRPLPRPPAQAPRRGPRGAGPAAVAGDQELGYQAARTCSSGTSPRAAPRPTGRTCHPAARPVPARRPALRHRPAHRPGSPGLWPRPGPAQEAHRHRQRPGAGPAPTPALRSHPSLRPEVPLQLITAKTRHRSPRTVMRYVRPGDAAVAEVTSLLGPPRRTH